MIPSDEGLDAVDRPRFEDHHRLVLEYELLFLERALKRSLLSVEIEEKEVKAVDVFQIRRSLFGSSYIAVVL